MRCPTTRVNTRVRYLPFTPSARLTSANGSAEFAAIVDRGPQARRRKEARELAGQQGRPGACAQKAAPARAPSLARLRLRAL